MFLSILFDLDETLYPYNQFVLGGFRNSAAYAFTHLGIDRREFFLKCLQEWRKQGNSGKIFNTVLKSLGIPDKHIPAFVNAFRSNKPALSPYHDAFDFISKLHGETRLGIITDGHKDVQRQKIKALGLLPYFAVTVFTEKCGRPKPSPLPYCIALSLLGSPPPGRVVYIGDNPYKDFAGAKKLGIYTVRLLRGQFRKTAAPPGYEADASFGSYADILKHLELR